MGGDEGNKHLMFFQGLMQRQGSTAAFALPGFPPQIHLPLLPPGPYACAGPGYAFAQAHAYAYPPPPPPFPAGPYAYPPQGYPHPQGSSAPHQGHGSSGGGGHSGGQRQIEITETTTQPKPGATAAATAATASATAAAYGGAIVNGAVGRRCFGNCCGGHRGTSFKQQHAGHGAHQGKFERGHGPGGRVEHVRGKFSAKRITWKH